jgi:hypothetical protein
MKKILPIIISSVLTFGALEATETPKYDCSPSELSSYIKVSTVGLSMPTSVSNPEDATQAIIETRKKQSEAEGGPADGEEEECFTLWEGDTDWETKWDEYEFPEFDFSKFGSMIDIVLAKIDEEFDKAMEKIEEEWNKSLCERIESVDWGKVRDASADYFGGKIDDKYGVDLAEADWWEGPMKKELNGEMKNLGDYVFDKEELKEDINSETTKKIKKKDDKFWDDI